MPLASEIPLRNGRLDHLALSFGTGTLIMYLSLLPEA
jgi:hypothetical protein